ncbi:MAG: hypothetical protein MRY32_06690 [Rickettsiales bacterium]|nr:hypothetical protein [Rickettsiales bacterium]
MDRSNPQHAQVNDVNQKTDQTVRLGLTALPARYIFRGMFKSFSDSATPFWLRKYTSEPVLNHIYANPLFEKINNHLAQYNIEDIVPADNLTKLRNTDVPLSEKRDIVERALRDTPKGQELKQFMRDTLRKFDSTGDFYNTLEYAIIEGDPSKPGKIALTNGSKKRIKSNLSEPVFESLYDNSLGVGSLLMTHTIRKRILHDIESLYSETVGYELGKDPHAVTRDDIFNSDNTIIQSTAKNFTQKQWTRLGISAIPFMKNIPSLKAAQFGELGIGAWGVLWAYDTWGRESTMLELLTEFVNDRLNPKFGIGDPIKPSDIINLYQNYAVKFRPETAFKSVATSDIAEDQLWLRSEGVFREIATLMNESYNYKHTSEVDPKTGLPGDPADFKLPKFIYLLGHDMINVNEPEWSMAYIKIANEYDMEAVKEVRRAQLRGVDLEKILKKYPVDPSMTTASERARHIVRDDARGSIDIEERQRQKQAGKEAEDMYLRKGEEVKAGNPADHTPDHIVSAENILIEQLIKQAQQSVPNRTA